jgi:hypothetical protein
VIPSRSERSALYIICGYVSRLIGVTKYSDVREISGIKQQFFIEMASALRKPVYAMQFSFSVVPQRLTMDRIS